jgi:hypothetical protein
VQVSIREWCIVNDEKLIEKVEFRLGPTMFADLSRMACSDDRSVGEYVRHVVAVHLYGAARLRDRNDGR